MTPQVSEHTKAFLIETYGADIYNNNVERFALELGENFNEVALMEKFYSMMEDVVEVREVGSKIFKDTEEDETEHEKVIRIVNSIVDAVIVGFICIVGSLLISTILHINMKYMFIFGLSFAILYLGSKVIEVIKEYKQLSEMVTVEAVELEILVKKKKEEAKGVQ